MPNAKLPVALRIRAPSFFNSLNLIGYETIASLKGADPEEMYQKECDVRGQMVDRCQLYMYRMVVYYASSKNPDPKKLKWWIWKD